MKKKTALIIAGCCTLGLSVKVSRAVVYAGTVILAGILAYFLGIYGIVSAAIIIFIIGTSAVYELIYQANKTTPNDILIDKVVGQLLTFALVADDFLYQNLKYWWIYPLGLLFFIFFTICKLGPVKWLKRHPKNAYCIMADDVFAGLMASICLWMSATYYVSVLS